LLLILLILLIPLILVYNEVMPDLPEKEALNQLFNEDEKFPVVEEGEPQISKEIEPLVQKLEKEIYLSKPITDDYGQPLVSPPAPQNPKITLPVTKSTYAFGLAQGITESVRWLAEWCLRIIKIFGPRAIFREEKNTQSES